MKQYKDLMQEVLHYGTSKGDRTGTGTTSIFGHQMKFDLRKGFPLVTTKKVHLKSIIHELLWLIKGDTNIQYLKDNKVRIWDEWCNSDGDLGNVYGKAWRDWVGDNNESIDQLRNVVDRIKSTPDCRRLIVSAWNPTWIPNTSKSFDENIKDGKGALPPCHAFFQFYTCEMSSNERELEFRKQYSKELKEWDLRTSELESKMDELNFPTRYIDLQLYQRSADLFLGVPFNIASYALLLMMVGQVNGMIPRRFVHTFGDVHIYNNHKEQIELQLSRECRTLPTMLLNKDVTDIDDFKYEDFELINYEPHPPIKGTVSV